MREEGRGKREERAWIAAGDRGAATGDPVAEGADGGDGAAAIRDADRSAAGSGASSPFPVPPSLPRLAFLGVGWIGRNRLDAVLGSGAAEVVGIADPSASMRDAAGALAPAAELAGSLDELLELEPDGVVIATPSALHAEQSIAVLERGAAVFCQKPLGRTAREAGRVVDAARAADRLLAIDFCYRHTEGMRGIRDRVRRGELGRVYAADLVFHNAYGPDKPWFYDRAQSGGGCLMDLGVHLIDLALWTLEFPAVQAVDARLFAAGRPLGVRQDGVEDYATVRIDLEGGAVVQLACSWRLPAGRDAVIGATFYGTEGGAGLHNVDGSFYDFTAEHYRGTARETLASPPDDWSGRAVVQWAERLALGHRFDSAADHLVDVAEVIDLAYGTARLNVEC